MIETMNTILWILQGILALLFAMAGIAKVTQPAEKIAKTLTLTARYPTSTVRMIGLYELLGALGLILPWWTRIYPALTPVAATGLVLVMVFAAAHHINYKEWKSVVINLVLLVLAAVVALGRFGLLL